MPKHYGNRSNTSIQQAEHDEEFGVKRVMLYEDNGDSAIAKQTSLVAKKITVSGNYTYVGSAPIGTSQSTAGWQVKRIQVSGSDTIITWKDGDSNFDNTATDLTAGSFS